jgi:hypothetical protein
MIAQWRVAYYGNLNTCANSQKLKITYIEIQIPTLVGWNKTRNHLHHMDVIAIIHNVDSAHNAKP